MRLELQPTKQSTVRPPELRCPRCFVLDIVPSMPRGVIDELMRKLGRVPKHCRCCGRRFYARGAGVRPF